MSRGKKLLKIINQNKPFLAVFSLFLSLLLVVGSTYSWITYSDEKINTSKSNAKKLSAIIEETFTPNLQWVPGKTTTNELSVKNNGQIPAIVRISLYEFFAQFELDMTDSAGNGSRKIVNHSSGSDMQVEDVSTWAKKNTYKVASGKYFTASEVYKGDISNPNTAYVYKGNRRVDSLSYLTIQFNDKDIYDEKNKPISGRKNYWYYSDGYFYYSEVLQPKEKTKQLVQSVVLEKNIPNQYKGSLYQLIPVMDAHDSTTSLLKDWKITSNSYVETMYRGKVH
ncbi:BsaA family SipW-dependent biofilm matrix protein [Enterococcus caccae]|uniref:Alternate signal-mediated exported protein n=1 Tax=Enterococcus caccae ATCC BAA-1240 TaxID=1158612 RepID=R3U1E8_9ENTE|nr:BsaA family SipW-dependent biofilm matrix protein [Enterococcus caccae]EOL47709.1 alternate signal-mediated exported protein [Enterococcus caccae ATCC BAA-1240]EOT65507.1 hypothetical protein I580_01263 [Enterococcus caccae ATCC BAA-1240]OJG27312.1 alternate signal-mediated exported protein [Enterococcus caccae]